MRQIATGLAVLWSSVVLAPLAQGQATAPLASVPGFGLPVLRTVAADEPADWIAPRAETRRPASLASADEAWEQSFAPYLWVPAIDGKVTVKGNTAPVDVSIGDTIDALNDLDFAFIGHYEARHGDSGFMADVVYLDLPGEANLPNGAEVESEFKAAIVEVGGFQEVERWDADPQDARQCALEVIGGVRVWSLDVDLDVDALGIHGSGDEDWVDPFIGLRVLSQLDERWAVVVRADVGGFGIFNGADGTWQVTGTVTYATSESGQLGFGWRTLSVDYDHANFEIDTRLSGPFVGYNFRF